MKAFSSAYILCFLCLSSLVMAQAPKPNKSIDYIEQYKDIAISEMERTGIPASIKLAQGLVESGAGQSTLSREAKNHFGIKCGGGWEGPIYKHKDDDYNSKGQLIKSCFRKFDSAYQSYIAHSEFLQTQRRYATLFDLSKRDYHAWAKGLRKAGYATDPAYANKLINIIEKYTLFLYDDASGLLADNAKNNKVKKTKPTSHKKQTPILAEATPTMPSTRSSKSNTTKKYRSRKSSNATSHRVRDGETMASIAQLYDLDLTIMRLRNRIPKDAEPLVGERIHLRKKISLFKRPKFTRQPDSGTLAAQEEYIF